LNRFNAIMDGAGPLGGLIADSAGNLYGTASWAGSGALHECQNGGFHGCGTVFELSPPPPGSSKWTKTVLYRFTNSPDGSLPTGELVFDQAGNLYGTTVNGGGSQPYPYGVVYQLSPPVVPGDPWTETVLYRFTGQDGQNPYGGVVVDAAGNLLGTTEFGGQCGRGVAFKLSPPAMQGGAWTEQVIHNFCGQNDGHLPYGRMALATNGDLYGLALFGPQEAPGMMYKLMQPPPGHTLWGERILYTFAGGSDGVSPASGVAMHETKLYGTTQYGGTGACTFNSPGCGIVFELTPPNHPGGGWTKATIYNFTGAGDGTNPAAGVIFDKNGTLYGTTTGGGNPGCENNGSSGCGVVYQLTSPGAQGGSWTETTLYSFTGDVDGGTSRAPLIIGTPNGLYGTTYGGGNLHCSDYGTTGCGVVFKVVP
jgi:hypothetical protein